MDRKSRGRSVKQLLLEGMKREPKKRAGSRPGRVYVGTMECKVTARIPKEWRELLKRAGHGSASAGFRRLIEHVVKTEGASFFV